ncbi:S-phase kinase-associated protein 1 [Drosophila subobscura]|uniref:S-phase kinase-associated protein 1 n=1 Tax=Drosophila subobscura TaxID=7241 RepID=UPI00155ABB4D|nr:S-phase kinase-associated protein 1 [Drosophila subobscura]
MPVIRLESSDGVVFDTDAETAKCSGTIRHMLEDCRLEDEVEEQPLIPVPNVNSTTLQKILSWAQYHRNDVPTAEEDETEKYPVCQWDADFLATVDQGTLFELIMAANYLDIRALMNAACQTVANMIKGHTSDEIRLIFNIPREATEEDLCENESSDSEDDN